MSSHNIFHPKEAMYMPVDLLTFYPNYLEIRGAVNEYCVQGSKATHLCAKVLKADTNPAKNQPKKPSKKWHV